MSQETQQSIKSFKDLISWQEAHKLVIATYTLTKTLPKEEIFGLTSQLRRSAVSISSNLAEGFGRNTYKDRIHFYYMAHGSLTELHNQFIILKDVHYISDEDFNKTEDQIILTDKLIQGLIKKSKSFLTLTS